MTGLGRVAGYAYRDDTYCPDCIPAIAAAFWSKWTSERTSEEFLDVLAEMVGFDRSDEASFSDRDFPKRLYAVQVDEPWLCESCRTEIR